MKDNMLEVGDELYYYGTWGDEKMYAGKIDRVTNTLAFIGSKKIKRKYFGSTTEPGHSTWSFNSYHLLTPEIKDEIRLGQIKRKKVNYVYAWGARNLKQAIRELTDSQLDRIVEILKEGELNV